MQSQAEIADLICRIDLDKEILGWDNGKFYAVNSRGRVWINMMCKKKGVTPPVEDYRFVADKVKEFLETYEGKNRRQMEKKLDVLYSLSSPPAEEVPQQKWALVPKKYDGRIKKIQKMLVRRGSHIAAKLPSTASKRASIELSPPAVPNFFDIYDNLKRKTESIRKDYLPSMPIDKRSCRVNWIFSPEKTNVKLDSYPEKEHGYIHANYISLGEGLNFIGTIYPLHRGAFWSMVYQEGNVVVDITNKNDLKRNTVKPYYPQKIGETCIYNDHMLVRCKSKTQLTPTLIKYELQVVNKKTRKVRKIDRIHYTGWEDVQGTNEKELKDLIHVLEPYLGKSKVPIMHCMGGVGRTGTALTGVAMRRSIDLGEIVTSKNMIDHMKKTILLGRMQRGPEFVQTETQLQTLWKLGQLLLGGGKENLSLEGKDASNGDGNSDIPNFIIVPDSDPLIGPEITEGREEGDFSHNKRKVSEKKSNYPDLLD